jgi:hypothetical protein
MNLRSLAAAGALSIAAAAFALPAVAQNGPDAAPMADPDGVPDYQTWQSGWDQNRYDEKHVILGTVADFKPYRLQLIRAKGPTQTIDLKSGTAILPVGMTPQPNQRVAVVGYYSNGTFVANRVILHQ